MRLLSICEPPSTGECGEAFTGSDQIAC